MVTHVVHNIHRHRLYTKLIRSHTDRQASRCRRKRQRHNSPIRVRRRRQRRERGSRMSMPRRAIARCSDRMCPCACMRVLHAESTDLVRSASMIRLSRALSSTHALAAMCVLRLSRRRCAIDTASRTCAICATQDVHIGQTPIVYIRSSPVQSCAGDEKKR